MREGMDDLTLFDIREMGTTVSFTVVVPGTPYVSIRYVGALTGDEIRLVGSDENHAVYTLTAHRIALPAPPLPQAPAPAPPPQAAPPPVAAAAAPPQRAAPAVLPAVPPAPPPAPARAAAPTPRPPAAVSETLEGEWTAEQSNPGGSSEATIRFTRNGRLLSGTMRAGGDETPLFDIRQSGETISFARVIPGAPYVTVNYSGTLKSDGLQLSSQDGAYKVTARRAGTEPPQVALLLTPPPAQRGAPAVPTPAPARPAPPAPAIPPPAASPPPPAQVAATPPPPPQAPTSQSPAPHLAIPNATASGRLDGNWIADQSSPGSAAPIRAALVFAGNHGTMHVGADDWPLFDVRDTATEVAFTLVIPGAPYITIHYGGMIGGDGLRLVSLDEGQGAFTLNARRAAIADAVASAPPPAPRPAPSQAPASRPPQPAIAAPQPNLALLNPPPPAPAIIQPPIAAPAPRVSPPSPAPPPAAPPRVAAAPAGPPLKLPLPALHDVLPNALVKMPPMGWASRGKLGTDIDQNAIRDAAESLDETGLRAAGYTYVEVDEGWQGRRDANGAMQASAKFPDMRALGDTIHSKGLKFGLEVSAAPKSCSGFEGSYGHETDDAKTFASWGVDYVVYDWCGTEMLYPTQAEQQAAYQKMSEALRASGRDIAFGISQNGAFAVASWGSKTGANLWRTGPDVKDDFQSAMQAGFAENGTEAFAGPGKWNDPGLIQVGNGGMTPDEYRSQLNLWAVLAAPMMLGNEVRIMTKDTVATLTNQELLAIDQDSLGRQGKRVAQNGQTEAWARPLADGSVALALFNHGDQSAPVAVSWQQLGIDGPRRVRDVWWHENIGAANGRYVVFLTAHTSLLLRLSR